MDAPLCFSGREDSVCARLGSKRLLLPSTSHNITYSRTCTKWLDYSHLSPGDSLIFPSGCTAKWGRSPTSAEAQSALRSDARSPNYPRLPRGMWRRQRWDRKPTSLLLVHSSDHESPSCSRGSWLIILSQCIMSFDAIIGPSGVFFSTLASCFVSCCFLFGRQLWMKRPLYKCFILEIVKPNQVGNLIVFFF